MKTQEEIQKFLAELEAIEANTKWHVTARLFGVLSFGTALEEEHPDIQEIQEMIEVYGIPDLRCEKIHKLTMGLGYYSMCADVGGELDLGVFTGYYSDIETIARNHARKMLDEKGMPEFEYTGYKYAKLSNRT